MYNQIDLAIQRISHLRTGEKLILQGMNLSRADFLRLDQRALRSLGLGGPRGGDSYDPHKTLSLAEADMRWLSRPGTLALPLWNPDFPPLLRQLYDPPFVLFLRYLPGNRPSPVENGLFRLPTVALVGTRKPSAAGQALSFQLGGDIAAMGVLVVSGLARGIDAGAHGGCVERRGLTVAVLGHGPDRVYPAAHGPLARNILNAGGCLVSEFPPGTEPRPWHFPQRNRIISGLSSVLVVVEAPEKSGALISADFALEQGRDVVVIGQLLHSRLNAGGRALHECGAPALFNAGEICSLMDIPR